MQRESLSLGREIYDRQVSFLEKNDTDGLIESNYHPDAELVNLAAPEPFVIQGRDNLQEYFKGYMAQIGGMTLTSTDKFMETSHCITFQATVETGAYGTVRVYDSFFLRDGKIYCHVTGLLG